MVLSARDFRADCANCVGLCCVAFAFDSSDDFAIDKPADVPCPNLRDDYLCSIHESLEEEGFGGCARYDCLGAGQLVTQELFEGRGWRENPAQFAPMMQTFRNAREVQSLRAMLVSAGRFPLSKAENEKRLGLLAECEPDGDWSRAWIDGILAGTVPRRVKNFLTSLRHHIERGRRPLR
ncbi:hypothetical protein [Primorskyibacter flagellatus]|uniref:Pentapeptide repeat-containing protein n=1 Tax=Primorskyibacter flagellatus TaxID=1387277 RepID=A0A1W1YXG5_9RHOB|nr:hypothetical protein [Primorskyibacter flagellatus]SMC40897.1 hypothetical protein SAMN06295998_10162 [Primorskyibacter flagellatus]